MDLLISTTRIDGPIPEKGGRVLVAGCRTEVADLDDAVWEDQDVPRPDSRRCFRVQGAGCRVQGAGCRVQGAGFRVRFRLEGLSFVVWVLGFGF